MAATGITLVTRIMAAMRAVSLSVRAITEGIMTGFSDRAGIRVITHTGFMAIRGLAITALEGLAAALVLAAMADLALAAARVLAAANSMVAARPLAAAGRRAGLAVETITVNA